jgi:uncharacterized GH25 family protein
MRTPILLTALLSLASAAAVSAHDMWIEPSSFSPAPGARMGIKLRVGQQFDGDPLPREAARIVRFMAITAAGESPVPGVNGTDPAGLLVAPAAGLLEIEYTSNPEVVDLEAPRFESYLHEEGLEKILDLRAEHHETGQPTREMFSRCAKSLIRIGGATGPQFDRVLGQPLEIVPENDPTSLAPGGALRLRVLFNGKPIANAKVTALQHGHATEALSARTDAAGRVRLSFPRSGIWLVKSVNMVPAPSVAGGPQWRSYWASLTFELAAGPTSGAPSAHGR